MGGDALELALALYRAPIQRFALRGRPLPGDIGVVIQMASGTQPFLREAATRRCESEETILEAARFYLQQVLFEPDADAYRVLGLAPGAQPERIREHYHWLQRWLHPDRRGEEWEALLATRVNWAWQHLRNETGRCAYNTERERSVAEKSDNPDAVALMPTGKWKAMPLARPPGRWSKRLVLGISFGSCLGLLYLALTRHDSMSDDSAIEHSATVAALPATAIESHVTTPAATPAMDRQVAAEAVSEPKLPALDQSPDAMPSATLHAASMIAAKPKPTPVATPAAPMVAVTPSPLSIPRVSEMPSRPVPTAVTRAIAVAAVVRRQDDAVAASRIPAAVVPNKSVATTPEAVVVAVPKLRVDATSVPAIEPPTASELSATAVAGLQAKSDKVPLTTLSPKGASVSADRIDLAHQRIEEVATYFGRFHSVPPPVWNDATGQIGAERQRNALHERSQLHSAGDFEVDSPTWRMSEISAALSAGYRLRRGRSVSESGHLSLDMIWREKMWLVTRVELEPAP